MRWTMCGGIYARPCVLLCSESNQWLYAGSTLVDWEPYAIGGYVVNKPIAQFTEVA